MRLWALVVLVVGAGPVMAAPQWQAGQAEEAAWLHYGEGERSPLGFFCTPGAGVIGLHAEIADAATPPEGVGASLSFTIAGARYSTSASPFQAGYQAMLAADDPLFAALNATGEMVVEAGGGRLMAPLPGRAALALQRACAGY